MNRRDAIDYTHLEALAQRAAIEPIEVDISDYSDEWCAGFLCGQVNVVEALLRAWPREAT